MSSMNEELIKKYAYEPNLNIYKEKPKDEESECRTFISKLKEYSNTWFLILGGIIALAMILLLLQFFYPKMIKIRLFLLHVQSLLFLLFSI